MSQTNVHGDKIGRVVATPDTPSFQAITVRLDAGTEVRPGEILLVSCGARRGNSFVVLRVSGAREYNEYETPLDSQVRDVFGMDSARGRDDLLRKFVLVSAQPIELMKEKAGGGWVCEDPHVLVAAGTEVYKATSGAIESVLGFSDPKGASAMDIGEVVGNAGIKVTLDADKVLPRHILVAGSTGTGKSYLLGVLAEDLKKLGIRHVNVDIHGEMVKAAEELKGVNMIPGRDLKVQLSSLSEPEVMEILPLTNDLHKDIAVKAFSNLKKTGRKFGVEEFKQEALRVTAQFSTSSKSTASIIESRIDILNGVDIIGEGFDWVKALGNDGALVNLDCREIASHSELKVIVGAIARELMSLKKKGKIKEFCFSMDEAHLFLPSGDSAPSSHVLGELIRYGRHHGVGIIIASQSPNDIDKRIAKITNTRFFFAIEQTELNSVAGLLGDTPHEIVSSLPRLSVGTCLLVGSRDTVKHSQIVQVKKRETHHGGETPKMVAPKTGA